MSKSKLVHENINDYVKKYSMRLSKFQQKIIEHTLKLPNSIMLGSADEVQLFQILLKSMNAKKCLEIGCYTGYTTLSLAMALQDDGKVVTLDITDEYVAKDIWKEAEVDHKIELIINPALDTLDKLIQDEEKFDFAFIDADKFLYKEYYERALKLVRKNGLIAIDNVLWNGDVTREPKDEKTQILHDLNVIVKNDPRVDISMLPIGDGVTLCCVK